MYPNLMNKPRLLAVESLRFPTPEIWDSNCSTEWAEMQPDGGFQLMFPRSGTELGLTGSRLACGDKKQHNNWW